MLLGDPGIDARVPVQGRPVRTALGGGVPANKIEKLTKPNKEQNALLCYSEYGLKFNYSEIKEILQPRTCLLYFVLYIVYKLSTYFAIYSTVRVLYILLKSLVKKKT